MEVVEASMEVSSGKFRGSAVKVAGGVSMEEPVYVGRNSLHGSFHGSSGSFQE